MVGSSISGSVARFDSVNGISVDRWFFLSFRKQFKKVIRLGLEFDNNGENDIHFKGSERGTAKGWVGYLQHSTLTYNYSAGHLSLRRGNPYFFNMNESLLINSNFIQ